MNIETALSDVLSILRLQRKDCPYCRSAKTVAISRRRRLSHVRRCPDCALMYRWPKQDPWFNRIFYQVAYSRRQQGSLAMNLPSREEAARLKASCFAGSPKDASNYVAFMKALGVESVLDFGCSWGYVVYQLADGGLDAEGLEISAPRAAFGRESLGVTIHGSAEEVLATGRKYDCVFSSHVLEHLPSPSIALDFFPKVLKPGGILLIELPNCGGRKARELGPAWGPFSGPLHPLSFSADFFKKALAPHASRICFFDRPLDPKIALHCWQEASSTSVAEGDNLVVLAQLRGSP